MPKINKTFVDKIKPPKEGQALYYDDDLKGFGVRVTPSAITYIVQHRVAGKVCRVSIGRHGAFTPQTAEKEAKRLISLMSQGIDPNALKTEKKSQAVTLTEVFERYKESHNLKAQTLKSYEGCIRRCFGDWLSKPITNITKDMVEKRHKELSDANGPRGKGEAQANQAMRLLRALMNYAGSVFTDSKGQSVISDNPVKRLSQVKAWNRIARRQSVIQDHQLEAWYKAVLKLENQAMQDYLIVTLFTGLRRNESASLRWENIDLKTETLKIDADQSKNHHEHRLPLTKFLVDIFKRRQQQNKDASPYVFPGTGKGGHLVESKWSIGKVTEASKVKFMMHDLRRTFITAAERQDIPYYALKRLANHRNSNDVTSGYIVADVERLREPMEKITNHLIKQISNSPDLKQKV